jgi:RNA polymerase subunit RPABC4/transcription elongation factor Spt4
MAIIRCPYCHAIIDENDKYCNNCGTQLLFPEDDEVEEEIPGEKIIDVEEDEEEKDYDLEEPGEVSAGPREDSRDEEEEEERTDELVEKGAAPEEVILVDEVGARTAAAHVESVEAEPKEEPPPAAAPKEETKAYPAAAPEPLKPEDETTVIMPVAAASGEPEEAELRPVEEIAEKAETEAARPAPPPTFDTRELDGIGKTVELGRERVERMISVLAEKQKEAAETSDAAGAEKKTGTLPPWASRIKGAAAISEPGGMPGEAEEEIFPRRKPSDSGIGLPERLSQAKLPFEAPVAEVKTEKAAEEEAPLEPVAPSPEPARPVEREALRLAPETEAAPAGAEPEAEFEEEAPRPPFHFSLFLKAKAFDILFVGVFWLVALWVAARSMDATLFEILSVTSGPVLLLYGVYVGLYFFLFRFFLGETLGDRLFRERE